MLKPQIVVEYPPQEDVRHTATVGKCEQQVALLQSAILSKSAFSGTCPEVLRNPGPGPGYVREQQAVGGGGIASPQCVVEIIVLAPDFSE